MTEPTRGRRPLVLTFLRHYLPGYKAGGPIRTIANLVETLGDEIDFRIVTTDRDSSDHAPYPTVQSGGWESVGKAQVLYGAPGSMTIQSVSQMMRSVPCDAVYLNSFFDPTFSVLPILANWSGLATPTKLVVAPRGEFAPNALRLKPIKKRAFLRLSKALGLHRNLVWQASTEREAADIHAVFGEAAPEIRIAADLTLAPTLSGSNFAERSATSGESLKVIFLSRISPMKNLEFAVEVMRRACVPATFDIYGPVSDKEYWQRCQNAMKLLPDNIDAVYRGAADPSDVQSILSSYDVLFLPTLGENFGHVILEALAAGTPALISDTTPWNDLAEAGAGWALPLDSIESFVQALHLVCGLTSDERAGMRAKARAYARQRVTDRAAVEANRRLFSL